MAVVESVAAISGYSVGDRVCGSRLEAPHTELVMNMQGVCVLAIYAAEIKEDVKHELTYGEPAECMVCLADDMKAAVLFRFGKLKLSQYSLCWEPTTGVALVDGRTVPLCIEVLYIDTKTECVVSKRVIEGREYRGWIAKQVLEGWEAADGSVTIPEVSCQATRLHALRYRLRPRLKLVDDDEMLVELRATTVRLRDKLKYLFSKTRSVQVEVGEDSTVKVGVTVGRDTREYYVNKYAFEREGYSKLVEKLRKQKVIITHVSITDARACIQYSLLARVNVGDTVR